MFGVSGGEVNFTSLLSPEKKREIGTESDGAILCFCVRGNFVAFVSFEARLFLFVMKHINKIMSKTTATAAKIELIKKSGK